MTNQLPAFVNQATLKAARNHPSDIDAATEEAEQAIRSHEDFDEEAVNALVTCAVRGLVYDARHHDNRVLRSHVKGNPDPPPVPKPKVVMGRSVTIGRVYNSVYMFHYNGKDMGDVTGDEIDGLIANEDAHVASHQVKAAFLRWAKAKGVRGGKRIRDVIPNPDKAWRKWYQLEQEYGIPKEERQKRAAG